MRRASNTMNSNKDGRASGDMDMDGTDCELVGGTGDMNSIDTKNIFRTLSNPDGDPTGGLAGAHEGHAGTAMGSGNVRTRLTGGGSGQRLGGGLVLQRQGQWS